MCHEWFMRRGKWREEERRREEERFDEELRYLLDEREVSEPPRTVVEHDEPAESERREEIEV
jgi:hypothetical protein